MQTPTPLSLADRFFKSRFLLGTAQYPSLDLLQKAIVASETEIVTVSLKRETATPAGAQAKNPFWDLIKTLNRTLLPNTAGCFSAQEAITTAQMAQEIFQTTWIKLEVIGDHDTLQPHPFELLKAAEYLVKEGFEVFPYCTDDLILCQRLTEVGCRILMPWAAPIGSGKGLLNPYALETLRNRLPEATLIIDAGLGKPSQAAQAMELGFDAVLLNTAVSAALDPVGMAAAFKQAIQGGRLAFEAGLMPERSMAQASTPLPNTPFWHHRGS